MMMARPSHGRLSTRTSPSFVTVTKPQIEAGGREPGRRAACRWCRRPLDQPAVGRPREFCRRSCRQRDFETRQRAASHGLDESALIVARGELDQLRDELYVLTCAVEDVERDLAGQPGGDDYRDAVRWLLDAARPLTGGADRFGAPATAPLKRP